MHLLDFFEVGANTATTPPTPSPCRHPNIVHLLDIFEVDANTFATVLELCPGGDLDSHLKEHTVCVWEGRGEEARCALGEGRLARRLPQSCERLSTPLPPSLPDAARARGARHYGAGLCGPRLP